MLHCRGAKRSSTHSGIRLPGVARILLRGPSTGRSEIRDQRRSRYGGPRHASSSFGATLMRTTDPGAIEADSGIRLPDDIRFRAQVSWRASGAGGSEREARKEAG